MKATGIIRHIDDLGRVVIPKEIRRTLKIREGDPMEIFSEGDNRVIFQRYDTGLLPYGHNLAERVEDNDYEKLSPQSVKEIHELLNKISKIIKEEEERYEISAVIYVERETQKGIIIGKGGTALKKVGTQARLDMEDFFQKKIYLNLFVKTDDGWRQSKKELKRFGYEW